MGTAFPSLQIGLPVTELEDVLRTCLSDTGSQELTLGTVNRLGRQIRCRVTCAPLASRGPHERCDADRGGAAGMRSGEHPHTMLGESIRAFADEVENVTRRLSKLTAADEDAAQTVTEQSSASGRRRTRSPPRQTSCGSSSRRSVSATATSSSRRLIRTS